MCVNRYLTFIYVKGATYNFFVGSPFFVLQKGGSLMTLQITDKMYSLYTVNKTDKIIVLHQMTLGEIVIATLLLLILVWLIVKSIVGGYDK